MTIISKTILFLIIFLIFSAKASSQDSPVIGFTPVTPNSKKLTIIYSDGKQIELANWYWHYLDTLIITDGWKSDGEPISSFPTLSKEEKKKKEEKEKKQREMSKKLNLTKASNNLMLSMTALNTGGVSLDDIELSESQLSSIKFVWKAQDGNRTILEKVIVTLTSGKTIEFPRLAPPDDYEGLLLKGETNLNGFSGKFSKSVSSRIVESSEGAPITEIKFK